MNYYSSRNFGKSIEDILFIGAYAQNVDLIQVFKERFKSNIAVGLDKFIDIQNDFTNDMPFETIKMIVDNLEIMLRYAEKSKYSLINLVTKEIRDKQNRVNKLKEISVIAIAFGVIALLPYMFFTGINILKQKELKIIQAQIDDIMIDYKEIENIGEEIKK